MGAILRDAQAWQQMRAQGQQMQAQNALRSILAQPDATDASGNPTPNALRQISAVDPATGMKLRQNMLVQQQNQLSIDATKTKMFAQKTDMKRDVAERSLMAYEAALQAGQTDAQAREAGQREYTDGVEELKKSGLFSEEEQAAANTTFDPIRVRGNVMDIKSWQASQAKAREDEERARHDRAMEGKPVAAGWDLLQDPASKDASGNPTPYRFNRATGEAVGMDGKPYAPGGAAKMTGAPAAGSAGAERDALYRDYKAATPDAPDSEIWKNVERDLNMAKSGASDTDVENTARMIASYQEAPLSSFAMSRGIGARIMAKVKEINPEYQSSRFSEVNKAMSAFGAGKQGDTVRAINAATQHLEVIDQAALALKNNDVRLFNVVGNTIARELGVPAPTTFDGLKQIVGTEIEKAVAGGIGAVADRDRLMKSLDSANSPQQLASVITGFKQLMAGQAVSLKTQYEDATGFQKGDFAFEKKLSPAAMRALGMGGAEPAAPKSEPKAPAADIAAPTSKAEYDALPAGAKFKAPDGIIRVKPGAAPAKPFAIPDPKPGYF